MSLNNIGFYYVVGGDDSHYKNLKISIDSVRKLYPSAQITVGDFDGKLEPDYTNDLIIHKLDFVKYDKSKIYKHIIWQYKYYICLLGNTRYNLYLDSDTVLANNLDEIIINNKNKFAVAKHFFVPTIRDFKLKCNLNDVANDYLNLMGLKDEMDFCAAGVFFFDRNPITISILQKTFELHNSIYSNIEYIHGIYDEPILNSILQKNKDFVQYVNGSLNHCSMIDMPLKIIDDKLYGKNNFDKNYEPVICLHCDISRRDPSQPFEEPLKTKIKNLFKL